MENEKNQKEKKSKKFIILMVVCVIIMVGFSLVIYNIKMNGNNNSAKASGTSDVEEESQSSSGDSNKKKIAYESNVITDDSDNIKDLYKDMVKKAKEGNMALEMQVEAHSKDGKNFTCYLANSKENKYDMFMSMYTDLSLKDELLLTGLIPIGARMERFTINRTLDKGEYDAVLVYTQVENNLETIHAQVSVTIKLYVD